MGSPSDRDSGRHAVDLAAMDGEARRARRALCRALTDGFEQVGERLILGGHIIGPDRVDGTSPFGNGDDSLVALGYLSRTAAALVGGASQMLDVGNRYAAGTLTRQLVEVEYLHWAFAEDHDEAAAWLRSNRDDRLKRWQPRHLRERSGGRFRGVDYAEHCEHGGHPTPGGARSLLRTDSGTQAECLHYELAHHGASTWEYLLMAIKANADHRGWEHPLPDLDVVSTAISDWHLHDRFGEVWETIAASRTPEA